MGYSYERGAAARNLLRARAHGHEDVISDAETLAYLLLGSDYEDDDIEVEEYIADHYADFIPEPPVITDDRVRSAAREFWLSGVEDRAWGGAAWDDMGGGEPCEERALAEIAAVHALRAAFNIEEN